MLWERYSRIKLFNIKGKRANSHAKYLINYLFLMHNIITILFVIDTINNT